MEITAQHLTHGYIRVTVPSARNPGAGALKYVPLVDARKAAWLS